MTIRKVAKGWYTATAKAWDINDTTELHFDVWKFETGKYADWTVSWRDSSTLNRNIQAKITSFDSCAAAKKYAVALAEAVQSGADVVDPAPFEEFSRLTFGFETDRWNQVTDSFNQSASL